MATIYNDAEYQARMGRIASGQSVMAWTDASGFVEVPVMPQLYGTSIISGHSLASAFGIYCDAEAKKMCSEVPTPGHNSVSLEFVFHDLTTNYETVDYDPVIDVKIVCPDCKGTKVYVGFTKTEPCAKCNGAGEI